jgi:hypothetical protein
MASLHAKQERQMMLCFGGPELLASSAPPGSAPLDLRAAHSRCGPARRAARWAAARHALRCAMQPLHPQHRQQLPTGGRLPRRRLARDKGLGLRHWELFVGLLQEALDSLPEVPPEAKERAMVAIRGTRMHFTPLEGQGPAGKGEEAGQGEPSAS